MGAAHLNWAVPEGTAHVEGSRPPVGPAGPCAWERGPREAAWPLGFPSGAAHPLGPASPFLGGGVDASPLPLCKGGSRGGGEHPIELSLPIVWRSSPLSSSTTSTSHWSLSHVVPLSELRRFETTPLPHAVVLRVLLRSRSI